MATTTPRFLNSTFKDFHDQLDDIREKELFCDVRIKLNNGEKCSLSVHRAVLASCSPFFRSLFTTALSESGQVELELPGISSSDMQAVIRFAYTNQANLAPENVESIFMTADRLHVFGLLKLCVVYLEENIDTQNALGIWKLARHFSCWKLQRTCYSYILKNFANIAEWSSEFLQLSSKNLSSILQEDHLDLPIEGVACNAVVKWIEHDADIRKRSYHQLLASVRLGLVDKRTYETVILTNPDIMAHKFLNDKLNEGYSLSDASVQTKAGFYLSSYMYMLKPRIPSGVIFILGGWTNESVCGHIETYDSRVDKWYAVHSSKSEKPLAYHALVPLGEFIYVIGGFTTYACVNAVRRCNPVKKEWETVASMHAKRCYVGAAAVDGYIYACGGYDGQNRHSSAERFNPTANQWTCIQNMRSVRSDSGVASLNGKLYVCGGFDGHTCLSSVEVYNPLTNQWTYIQDLSIPRSGVALVELGGVLIAIGGFNGTSRLSSVEKYDPDSRRWTSINSMSLARSNFAVTTLDGQIFVIGGFNGTSTSQTVESYCPLQDVWKTVSDLIVGRSATSACTMDNLQNITDYTYYGAENQLI